MNFIIDPVYGTRYELFSTNGKNLLKQYVKYVQSGGLLLPKDKEILRNNINNIIYNIRDNEIGTGPIDIMVVLKKLHDEYKTKIDYKERMKYASQMILYKLSKENNHEFCGMNFDVKQREKCVEHCKGQSCQNLSVGLVLGVVCTIHSDKTKEMLFNFTSRNISKKQFEEEYESYKPCKFSGNELTNYKNNWKLKKDKDRRHSRFETDKQRDDYKRLISGKESNAQISAYKKRAKKDELNSLNVMSTIEDETDETDHTITSS